MADQPPGWTLGVELLTASRALFDELHRRLDERGHAGLRPAHGFVFQAVGEHGATPSELAGRLGMTKQAARLIVEELVGLGYLERRADPADARRRPVALTARGRDALRQSERVFDELRDELVVRAGADGVVAGLELLGAISELHGPAPLRPVW